MSSAARGRIVNREQLAGLLDIDLRTIDSWLRRGCPIIARGGRGRAHAFDSAAVIDWHLERSAERGRQARQVVSLDEARQRKTSAEASLAELDLDEMRRSLVPVDLVAVIAGAVLAAVAHRLEAVPAEVAERVAKVRSPAVVRRVLEEEFAGVLDALVNGPLIPEVLCKT